MNTLDAVFVDINDFCHILLPTWENTSFLPVSNKETSLLISPLAKRSL
ncbi:hypothetical protein [Candidatus Enterovibrio escicola]|nr:hypothetical protein [Candidatus Enterovibrio escacola]